MIKQFRVDRFNGVEYLVCEMFARHTWTKEEVTAYNSALDVWKDSRGYFSQAEFRVMLDEWLSSDRSENDTFFGLVDPIPLVELVPHVVLRAPVVKNRAAALSVEYASSVTTVEIMDAVQAFYEFLRSPHWRNTIAHSISDYGSLFGSN